MANNTRQFHEIVTIEGNLEILFVDDPDVFVIGDLLWYPVEGHNEIRQAPDVMVAFGRPKGHRGAYLQWREENIAPQVVFEILSPGNRRQEMLDKFDFYQRYGVEEYYVYDPDRGRLTGWLRATTGLLAPIANMNGWISPRLRVHFEMEGNDLHLSYPDGGRFLTIIELNELRREAELRADVAMDRADAAMENLYAAMDRAELEAQRAKQETQRAEQEAQRAALAEARVQELEAKLRAAGLL